jgi:hypothetical protein
VGIKRGAWLWLEAAGTHASCVNLYWKEDKQGHRGVGGFLFYFSFLVIFFFLFLNHFLFSKPIEFSSRILKTETERDMGKQKNHLQVCTPSCTKV